MEATETVQMKVRQSFVNASKDGNIEKAMGEAMTQQVRDNTPLDKDTQMKLNWSLGKATKEGRVEEAMTEAQKVVESKRAMEATETVQMKVRQSFVNASKDGTLEKAMGEAMTQQVRDSTPLDKDTQMKLNWSLGKATKEGRVEEAMTEAQKVVENKRAMEATETVQMKVR